MFETHSHDWYTQQRAVAEMHFHWLFDAWKLELGMLEVQDASKDEDKDYFSRRFRNQPVYGPREEPFRMLPTAPGWCVLVRDKR